MYNFTQRIQFYTQCIILLCVKFYTVYSFTLPFTLHCFDARDLLSWICALSSVKFLGLKLRLCKKKDKYEVCACLVVSLGVNVYWLVWPELIDVYGQISLPVHVTDAAKMLLRCWCCWCADAMMLLMQFCCWCTAAADALMLLMLWCCWCSDAADALMLLMMR